MRDDRDPKEEDDKVAAAYENISKKLESLRSGDGDDGEHDSDEDSKEPELEEWKGPRGMKKDEVEEDEEDEAEIRKVKLKNLASEDEESDEDTKERRNEDLRRTAVTSRDEEEDEDEPKSEKKWEPPANDPLDEEEENDDIKDSKDAEESEDELDDIKKPESEEEESDEGAKVREDEDSAKPAVDESEESPVRRTPTKYFENETEMDFSKKRDPQPDSLDDLAENSGTKESEDDYHIPNLKGSRQEGSNIGYNARSETDSFARGYQDKNDMDNMQNNSGNTDPNNFFSQHGQSQAPKRANKFHLLVLVLIGVAVIGFTVYILKGGFGQISMTAQPSPSPSAVATPLATPTPTPAPDIDRSKFNVRVLNGTSTSGLAKTVNDKLKELGYDATNPGNATNSAFTQTVIRVKSGSDSAALLQRLILDLAPDYQAVESTNLNDSASSDAEVILGGK